MLSPSLGAILQDLRNRRDVSKPMQRILDVEKSSVSIAQQLEFAKALLDLIIQQPTSAAASYFPAAISCLRALAPSLKAGNSTNIDVIAHVENYTVKFAWLMSKQATNSASQERAFCELQTSLRLLFETRFSSSSKASRRPSEVSRPSKPASRADKENSDPQLRKKKTKSRRLSIRVQPTDVSAPLDLVLFPGASLHSNDVLLPSTDPSLLSRVITGALVIRLTSPNLVSTLSERIYVANSIVIPWLRHLQKFTEPSNCEYATCFTERLCRFLETELENDPCEFVKTRTHALALSLRKVPLNQYAYDLYRVVLRLVNADKLGLMHQDTLDVVVSVYESALQFIKSFPVDDPCWRSEDVSVWLDHVLHVWARINASALPSIFEERIMTTNSQRKAKSELLTLFKLQVTLFNLGAYGRKALLHIDRNDVNFVDPVWRDVAKLLKSLNIPDFFRENRKWTDDFPSFESRRQKERVEVYMRYLHIIDPVRSMILGSPEVSSASLKNNEILLRQHVSTTLAGLQIMSRIASSEGDSDDAGIKRLRIRMNKMAGRSMEVLKELVRLYWSQRQPNMICNVITCAARILEYHANWYSSHIRQWWEWFLDSLKSIFENARKASEISSHEKREKDESNIITVLKHCDTVLTTRAHSEEYGGRNGLLRILRNVYISRKDWCGASSASVKLLAVECSEDGNSEKCQLETAQSFVQDFVRAISGASKNYECFDGLNFSGGKGVSFPLAFGLLMEFQCHTRKNFSSFRTRDSYLETLFGLQRGRKFLLERLTPKNECKLRRVHRMWVDFVFGKRATWMSKEGKKLGRDLRNGSTAACDGHLETSAFNFEGGSFPCSALRVSLLAVVADMWSLTEQTDFSDFGDLIEELEDLRTITSFASCSREFLLVSGEILDWVSYSLALHDYDLFALQTNSFAEECREAIGIPRTHNPFLRDLCARVANADWFDWYFDGRVGDEWTASLKEVRLLCAGSNYSEALSVIENVEDDSLPSYEKALAYEYGRGDITSALLHSHKALKGFVWQVVSGKDISISNENKFQLSGATINIDTCIRVEAGQERMRKLLHLIRILFQYACLNYEAENINLGQYYMERCYKLASECLPKSNYMLLSVSAVYHAKTSSETPFSFLQDCFSILGVDRQPDGQSRNVISEYEMWSNIAGCRYRHSHTASNDDVIRAYDVCEGRVIQTKAENEEWRKRVGLEVTLQRAIAMCNSGEVEKAVDVMKPLLKRRATLAIGLRALGQYHFARSLCLLQRERGAAAKTGRRRVTRSGRKVSSSNSTTKEVENTIEKTIQLVTPEFNVPWICRRVFGLQSLMIKPSDLANGQDCSAEVALLTKKIGSSFNVRWQVAMKLKMEHLEARGMSLESSRLQNVEKLFKNMNVTELDHLIKLLSDSKCVVVGIDLDDLKEHIIVWRISAHGTFVEKRKLPASGPTSLRGIKDRINNVVSIKHEVAEPRGALTTKEKEQWWTDRFRLDEELGTIVSEIESEWIDDIGYLLDPDLGEEGCPGVNDEDLEQVVLLVDTELERIPWESVGILRERVISVTRAPSLAFLEHHLRKPSEDIPQGNMFYLINPTGEFSKTAGRFKSLMKRQRGWSGFCGPCTKEDVNEVYSGQRMYMYCGHGTGVAFISPRRFERTEVAPTALLMGCSSAKADNLGVEDEESNGAAIDFLIRGAPAVVGTLWDVSDGEIDRFTLSLLSLWAGANIKEQDSEFVPLAEAVARSRSACRTPYLVGAACIVIGAPNIRVKPSRGKK